MLYPFFSTLMIHHQFNMQNFNSTMDTSPIFQNPNPNFDHQQLLTHTTSTHPEFDDLLYFRDISNYLMSDDEGSSEGKIVLSQAQSFSNSITNLSDETSNHSIPPTRNYIKCRRRKVEKYYKAQDQEFRFVFRTRSDLEFMDDGFKWRKYGKKKVKSSPNLRNYFKCSSGGCSVKKRVERDGEDPRYVITTYQGMHNHETPTNCVLYCTQPTHSLFNTYSK